MAARILLFLVAIAFTGCNAAEADPWNGTTKLKVATTFAPLQCFAMNVAGDYAEVRSLLGSQGPHDANIPTSQAAMLARADLLFANGLKVDNRLVSKMTGSLGKTKLAVVKLGDAIPKDQLIEGICPCCAEEGDDHKHDTHEHKEYDGHVWLGIPQAKLMVAAMGQKMLENQQGGIIAMNPHPLTGAANRYIAKLDKLQADGTAKLKDKQDRTIVPFHGSLAYFAKNFDLKLTEPIQLVPGQEPTAKHLTDLIEQCVKQKARVIAVEPQYGADKSAKAVYDELKKRGLDPVIVTIDPLETATDGEMGPEWYETKMRANLNNLSKALK